MSANKPITTGLRGIFSMLNTIVTRGLEYYGIYYSFYSAIVMDTEDPKGLQRLKLKVPDVYGNQTYPQWIRPRNSYAGKGYGMKLTPEKGDLVTVEFQYGDARRPQWSYGYFAEPGGENEIDDPSLRRPKNHWLKTPSGLMVQMDDENESIHIKHPDGLELRVNKDTIDLVTPGTKTINLGSFDSAAEPAILGDTHEDKVGTILDNITQLTVTTAFGPSSVPINSASFLIDKAELLLYKSDTVKLD